MIEKLELKHLAPYLDCGIKFIIENGKIVELNPLHIFNNHKGYFKGLERNTLLILRPLSDLTKEIEVNGEKFVPIVKLSEIAEVDTTELVDCKSYKGMHGARFNIENDDDDFVHEVFTYTESNKMFGKHCRVYPHKNHLSDINFVPNQLDLFQKLYEWHFDIFDLIKSGLAIDINTL